MENMNDIIKELEEFKDLDKYCEQLESENEKQLEELKKKKNKEVKNEQK
jgi:hypothetical protein